MVDRTAGTFSTPANKDDVDIGCKRILMFSYYVALGIRSLLNQRLITIWMILLIALGVAGTVSTFSLLRAVSSNPFAAKAHRLFTPQIDNHGPEYVKMYGEIDPVLTLRDASRHFVRMIVLIYRLPYTKSVFHSFLLTRRSMRSRPTDMP
jgi:hypothetical protein